MGHVVNPINFRLGTVKIWNTNAFLDIKELKYHGYFAVISFNVFYLLSKIFRTRFFTYVTSYIFSHLKLYWKFGKIICFIFLFNGATEIGGYKTSSLISYFFPKQRKIFKKFVSNNQSNVKKNQYSLFPNRFFFETGFSYNFFYKMWLNKKLRYYGIYKPIMLDEIKRDGYKFLFRTKVKPESSTFQRFLFKHMMYKRKELRKKWNKLNNRNIRVKKHYRRFFLRKYLKYIYTISIRQPIIRSINRKPGLASLKYYINLSKFRKFVLLFCRLKLGRFVRERYKVYFYSQRHRKYNYSLLKTKKRPFRGFPKQTKSFKMRSHIFQELILRSKRKKLKKRVYILNLYNKFKFFINKFIKRLKFNIYKIFFRKILAIYFVVNCFFKKYVSNNLFILNNPRSDASIYKNQKFFQIIIAIAFYQRKLNLSILFKKGLIKVILNKFKIDSIFGKMSAYNLEIGLFKYNRWNFQKKIQKILSSFFYGFEFKLQFHFLNMKNVNAKIISYYIAVKLKQKYRLGSIIRDVKRYCNSAKEVRGWKINCAGRFSKKEIASSIVQKGGAFGYSSITSLLDFSFNEVILKYSICGIKVWFVLKRNFKKIAAFKSAFSKIISLRFSTLSKNNNKNFFFSYYKLNLQKHIQKYIKNKNFFYAKWFYFYFKNYIYIKKKKKNHFWYIWRMFLKKYKFIY